VTSGGLPVTLHRTIKQYRWSIDDPTSVLGGNPAVPPAATAAPTFAHVFGTAYNVIGQSYGPVWYDWFNPLTFGENPDNTHEWGHYFAYDVRFFRPGVMVTLQVTDSAGQTASITRRITFRNPDETAMVLYQANAISLGQSPNPYYRGGSRDPYTYDGESRYITTYRYEPDLTKPDAVVTLTPACDSRTAFQKRGLFQKLGLTVVLRPALLSARSAHLTVYSNDVTMTVGLPCRYVRLGCEGALELLSVDSSHKRNSRRNLKARELGRAEFTSHAGVRSAILRIRLNPRGSALARAHKLPRVTLRLATLGPDGRFTATSRTITVVASPTGRR
jgi:hypothetical protein